MPNGKKVLIIEDDKFLSLVLKSKMERDGFMVSEALDGEEGLAKARSDKPDVILLDLILPKMSGFEFMEVVRTDPELMKIPVLVASNLGQDSDIQKAKSLGVQDYFVKAVTPVDQIAAMVKKAVGLPEYSEPEIQPQAEQAPAQPEVQPQAETLAEAQVQIPQDNPPVDPGQPQQ
jgi:twitching motility two-component system response regulator PilH